MNDNVCWVSERSCCKVWKNSGDRDRQVKTPESRRGWGFGIFRGPWTWPLLQRLERKSSLCLGEWNEPWRRWINFEDSLGSWALSCVFPWAHCCGSDFVGQISLVHARSQACLVDQCTAAGVSSSDFARRKWRLHNHGNQAQQQDSISLARKLTQRAWRLTELQSSPWWKGKCLDGGHSASVIGL